MNQIKIEELERKIEEQQNELAKMLRNLKYGSSYY